MGREAPDLVDVAEDDGLETELRIAGQNAVAGGTDE